jgi:nicotinamidase-related amidase
MGDSAPQGPYEEIFSPHEIDVFRNSGHGGEMGLGSRPALLIVDTNIHFLGDTPEPILDSISRWPFSCGSVGWEAAESISRVQAAARTAGVPVIYTTGTPPGLLSIGPGRWSHKSSDALSLEQIEEGHEIVSIIAPVKGETIIRKQKPSAFFSTPLAAMLIDHQVDTVVICGGTTSGCVRASVVDAFSYNYRVAVVGEATFDRSDLSHKVSLFDLHQKYADVISERKAVEYFADL